MNGKFYADYKALAEKEPNVIFGGRLGEYKYYDMDQVIAAALEKAEELIERITDLMRIHKSTTPFINTGSVS